MKDFFNPFPVLKLLFQIHLILFCVCVLATLCCYTLWTFDFEFVGKQDLEQMGGICVIFFLLTAMYCTVAYLVYEPNYKVHNEIEGEEEEGYKPESYDDMTGEQIQ